MNVQNPQLFAESGIDFFIANVGDDTIVPTIKLTESIRSAGFSAEYDVEQRKLKAQFKAATRANAQYVITLGDEEIATKSVAVKRLTDGKQVATTFDQIETDLQNVLRQFN